MNVFNWRADGLDLKVDMSYEDVQRTHDASSKVGVIHVRTMWDQ